MVNGGDRCAAPWTNMHNNACNTILMIHGAAAAPHHVPSYTLVIVKTSLGFPTANMGLFFESTLLVQ